MSGDQPRVLLGVSGCIAAYKSCEILRGLQKRGVAVKVVMTEHGTHFVDPLTFRSLSHEPVAVGLFDDPSDPIHHISLAEECDLFLIAPATANVMAKIAHGIADDLLTTTALATTAPLMCAPAMNVHMYEAAATQANMALLKERGVLFVEPDAGYLACGDVGRGRLAEPDDIVQAVMDVLARQKKRVFGTSDNQKERIACESTHEEKAITPTSEIRDLAGKKVMITAGPTQEPIDAVRCITNHSSGKMGYALAQEVQRRGADVVLISGPVSLETPVGVDRISVTTANEMFHAAQEEFPSCDLAFFCAAVADMRPVSAVDRKLKKGKDDEALTCIRLVENPDILKELASTKRADQRVIGFAAETNDVVENAHRKLHTKGADGIVANDVSHGAVFGSDTNKAFLVSDNEVTELPELTKHDLAQRIVSWACQIKA